MRPATASAGFHSWILLEVAAPHDPDYHRMHHDPQPCSVAVGLGSHNRGVADVAAELYHAVHYRERALQLGVPDSAMLLESRATNTGENIEFTKAALAEADSELLPVSLFALRTSSSGRNVRSWGRNEKVRGVKCVTIDSYSAIAGEVGTVAAVIVALYLSVWRDGRRRAELNVLDFDAARLGDQVEISEPDRKSLWVRFPVVNSPRRRTAHDVEVTLETVEALSEHVSEELVRGIAGSAGRQLKWADRSDGTFSIHPGAVRRFDLFHVVTSGDPDCCRFTFRDLGQRDDGHPLGWQCVLPVGSYRVNLSMEAADLDSRQFCCVITWRGGFDLEISPVTRVI